jgi:(p)ppGpp synthase/HD superfamily hydrolase
VSAKRDEAARAWRDAPRSSDEEDRGDRVLDEGDLATAAAHSLAWHGEQSRKGSGVPYASHLLQVAGMVLEHGGDLTQAVAGLLHDCLEDAPSSEERAERESIILERFGRGALELVLACTDTRPEESIEDKAPWRLRKQRLLEQLDLADDRALLVAACDRCHNLRSLVADLRREGDEILERFNAGPAEQRWLQVECLARFSGRVPDALVREFETLVADYAELTAHLAG